MSTKKQRKPQPRIPESATVFEWRKVDAALPETGEKPLSHGSALLAAASNYRAACEIADLTIKMRDAAERKLLELARGKAQQAQA